MSITLKAGQSLSLDVMLTPIIIDSLWTEGVEVLDLRVNPAVVYVGQTVTISAYIMYHDPYPLPVNLTGSVQINGETISKSWELHWRNPTLDFEYVTTRAGVFTARTKGSIGEEKSVSFEVKPHAVGTFHSLFGTLPVQDSFGNLHERDYWTLMSGYWQWPQRPRNGGKSNAVIDVNFDYTDLATYRGPITQVLSDHIADFTTCPGCGAELYYGYYAYCPHCGTYIKWGEDTKTRRWYEYGWLNTQKWFDESDNYWKTQCRCRLCNAVVYTFIPAGYLRPSEFDLYECLAELYDHMNSVHTSEFPWNKPKGGAVFVEPREFKWIHPDYTGHETVYAQGYKFTQGQILVPGHHWVFDKENWKYHSVTINHWGDRAYIHISTGQQVYVTYSSILSSPTQSLPDDVFQNPLQKL